MAKVTKPVKHYPSEWLKRRSADAEFQARFGEILDALLQRTRIIHQRHQILQHQDQTESVRHRAEQDDLLSSNKGCS